MSDKYCKNCERNLIRTISNDDVEFICNCCGTITKGGDNDRLIKSYNNIDNEYKSSQMSDAQLQISAKDRTNERVNIKCKNCDRKYQSRIRDSSNIYIVCVCKKK
jgi:hypothetical protein